MPARQPMRGRLWLKDGSCVRLRTQGKNDVWAYDFVQVRIRDGRGVRLLTVINEYTRECLAIRAQRSIRSSEVIETLVELMLTKEVPAHNPVGHRTGVHVRGGSGMAWGSGCQNLVHRAWVAVGERVRGELQRKAQG